MDEFIAIEALHRFYRSWWLLAISAVIGGLGGYVFHLSNPPIYEAVATFFVSIDFSKLGELPLTQYDEDIALAATEWILFSPEVTNQVIDEAQNKNIILDLDALNQGGSIERRHAFWELRFRNPNPSLAQEVVNLWAETGYQAMVLWQEEGRIVDFVTFQPPTLAGLPNNPSILGRFQVVLAGSLIGLIVGLLFVEVKIVRQNSDS
jgi:uncharacterized protein involved in exopolysaccharide biosynthesis